MSSDIRSSTLHSEDSSPRYRQVSIGHPPIEVREEQGILHMRALEPLAQLPDRLLDRLLYWASIRPQQTFIAARDSRGGWRKVSYADMRHRAEPSGVWPLRRAAVGAALG